MAIINTTVWRTADISRIVRQVAKRHNHRKSIVLVFAHGRRHGVRDPIIVPKPATDLRAAVIAIRRGQPNELDNTSKRRLAREIGMRLALQRGIDHTPDWLVKESAYLWADSISVRVQQAPKKPTKDVINSKRLANAFNKTREWERKHKLATTKLELWTRRVKNLRAAIEKEVHHD